MTDSDSSWRIAERHFDYMRKQDEFTVTEQHLKLLRRAWVDWHLMEFGAPGIDGKRPYGNSDVLADIARVLGEGPEGGPHHDWDPDWDDVVSDWLEEHAERLAMIHGEVGVALQIALATGRFEAGDYVKTEKYDQTTWMPRS